MKNKMLKINGDKILSGYHESCTNSTADNRTQQIFGYILLNWLINKNESLFIMFVNQ